MKPIQLQDEFIVYYLSNVDMLNYQFSFSRTKSTRFIVSISRNKGKYPNAYSYAQSKMSISRSIGRYFV